MGRMRSLARATLLPVVAFYRRGEDEGDHAEAAVGRGGQSGAAVSLAPVHA